VLKNILKKFLELNSPRNFFIFTVLELDYTEKNVAGDKQKKIFFCRFLSLFVAYTDFCRRATKTILRTRGFFFFRGMKYGFFV
jgi:hypothetical protein